MESGRNPVLLSDNYLLNLKSQHYDNRKKIL